jgi:hypothetical protein
MKVTEIETLFDSQRRLNLSKVDILLKYASDAGFDGAKMKSFNSTVEEKRSLAILFAFGCGPITPEKAEDKTGIFVVNSLSSAKALFDFAGSIERLFF